MAETPHYHRIVVKAGTRLLTGGSDRLDLEVIASLAQQTAHLHQQGVQVVLVSSGAVAAGRHLLGSLKADRDIPARQVLAAVGQGHLMGAYERLFGQHGITVAQALVSRQDILDRLGYLNIRNTLTTLLEHQVVAVINENDVVAVEELGEGVFGDNDRLSAMVANLVDADLLMLLGEVPGLYTADPHRQPEAQLIPRVERVDSSIEAMARGSWTLEGSGGMVTKLEAARLATASGVAVVIADGRELDVIPRLAAGEPLGTLFPPTTSKLESRKRWMLSGLSTRGEVHIDSGAVNALREMNSSLLPPGVRQVKGDFQRGDIVVILDGQGQRIACGIANYGAREVDTIKGARSDHIQALLGYRYGTEVVHRDNLVLL